MGTHDKDAGASENHLEAFRAGRGPRKWPRVDRGVGGKQTYLAFDHPRFQEIPSDAILRPA
eukprot:5417740-Pyramimonas_sp.AAC.1